MGQCVDRPRPRGNSDELAIVAMADYPRRTNSTTNTAYLLLSYPTNSEARGVAPKANEETLGIILNAIATGQAGRNIQWTLTSPVQTGSFSMQRQQESSITNQLQAQTNPVIVVQMYHNGIPDLQLQHAVELVKKTVADNLSSQPPIPVEVLTYTSAATSPPPHKRR